jgi:hypothetical protein
VEVIGGGGGGGRGGGKRRIRCSLMIGKYNVAFLHGHIVN